MFTNSGNVVTISLVHSETFGGNWISRFLPYRPKNYNFYASNTLQERTISNLCTKYSWIIVIYYFIAIFQPVSEW